jgi:methylenetetrahydrofolate dehydrogenase (NADP+)/methenyltetrahydrofolate cyclohydrolase
MIVDGRMMAREVLARTKVRAEKLGRRPHVLVYIASHETPATRSYLKIKARSADAAGCDFEETRSLTPSSHADAIVVQLPLSPEVNTAEVLNAIPVRQDADVLSHDAREKFEKGDPDSLLPPVVGAVKKILEWGNIEITGKRAVVVGTGFLVGVPVALWLTHKGAHVTVVDRSTPDFVNAFREADIVVSGAGTPHLINPDMVKEGVVLIDAGTSESNGEIVGDIDPLCAEKSALFTPVPGGIGPLAVACLFENVVTLVEKATNT